MTNGECKKIQCACLKGQPLCDENNVGTYGFQVDFIVIALDLSEVLKEDIVGPATLKCQLPGFKNGEYNCEFDGTRDLSHMIANLVEPGLRENLGPFLGDRPVIKLDCGFGQCLFPGEIPGFKEPHKEANMKVIRLVGGAATVVLVAVFTSIFLYAQKAQREQIYQSSGGSSDAAIMSEVERMLESGHHLPVTLSFRNICYEAQRGGSRVRLLKGIHGIVKPGEVMAIMGSSGAGKTTCLDILAGKNKRGAVTGEILINGKVPTRQLYKRVSGYVDQEDTLMGTLTVYETLLYSALLRLPGKMSRAAKEQRVRETMAELGIEHIANSMIGMPGKRGISGGEKRRVSIALEVVTSPSILFLDEPTSGLDR